MTFEWNPGKAETNFKKHAVRFAEAEPVFTDDCAFTITDDESDPHEQRFVSIGKGLQGRILVVVYTYRSAKIRIISARTADAHERAEYEGLA
jgi:uncharacterized DUF497 family protein